MRATDKAVESLFAFVHERYQIHVRRQAGHEPPWTKDPILRDFRFCNVYREDDRVTMWIADNWRTPNKSDPDLWFAMCVARLYNNPDSLSVVGYPVPWRPASFVTKMSKYRDKGNKVFNAAYMVAAQTPDKIKYLENAILTPLWSQREQLRPKEGDSLCSYHMLLGQMHGFASFMTAQVIADMKYVEPLLNAGDWKTFAASGPGSRKGLNYVMGYDAEDRWSEDDWRMELARLRKQLLPMFKDHDMPEPHAQDIQNCLCEYSKYQRAKQTGQMPKQRYRWEVAA